MPQMIFVNLPVTDLARSMAFYRALGFDFDPRFTDDQAACCVIGDNIFAMLLTHGRFADFTTLPIADSRKTTAHLLAISRENREAVDAIADAALAAGGSEFRPAQDYGFMYSRAFADPDGHVWEPAWMDMEAAMQAAGKE